MFAVINKIISFFIYKGLHHNHIHTVFRAAEKVPSSPVLYDLWVGNSFTPSLESEVTSNYFSIDGTETEVYKAPIVQCSWWRTTKVGKIKCFFASILKGCHRALISEL